MAFATAATIAPESMVFGCNTIVDTLTYASTLSEESLAFMVSVVSFLVTNKTQGNNQGRLKR